MHVSCLNYCLVKLVYMNKFVFELQGEVSSLLKVCNNVISEVQCVRNEAREHNC